MDRKKVVIIGSGFGGSVAALRFAEAGHEVVVIERGDWIKRSNFEADPDMFWSPARQRFGMNDLRKRGKTIIPWLGSGVGGGSHVYAATIKRRAFFDDWPENIRTAELTPYYERAEEIMQAKPYPSHPPYSQNRSYQMMRKIQKQLADTHPDLVEDQGAIKLALSFAPDADSVGKSFTNIHGAQQRYAHPLEQKILGGDIGSKNTLDKNYLFLAMKHGAQIMNLSKADRIIPNADDYTIEFSRYQKEQSTFKRLGKNWFPIFFQGHKKVEEINADILVISAGSVGSTEILMRNKLLHKTLNNLSNTLGDKYFSNGDYVNVMLPYQGLVLGWSIVLLGIVGLYLSNWWILGTALVVYYIAMAVTRKAFDPDLGTTNSDYIKFKHRDGSTQGSYIEGGRYPTLGRAGIAFILSVLGLYRPSTYRTIVKVTGILRDLIPPLELMARTWPIPLLQMGRDDAVGRFFLNEKGKVEIEYNLSNNKAYYHYLGQLARMVAKLAKAIYIPNLLAQLTGTIEVPHNLGGAVIGDSIEDGVVDHAGRVFGYENLMVLDGSIIPVTLGPNPVGTILALSERGAEIALHQLEHTGFIRPED